MNADILSWIAVKINFNGFGAIRQPGKKRAEIREWREVGMKRSCPETGDRHAAEPSDPCADPLDLHRQVIAGIVQVALGLVVGRVRFDHGPLA
jgi:hypothetical protein